LECGRGSADNAGQGIGYESSNVRGGRGAVVRTGDSEARDRSRGLTGLRKANVAKAIPTIDGRRTAVMTKVTAVIIDITAKSPLQAAEVLECVSPIDTKSSG